MGTLHTSVGPHKSCGCKACIKGLKKGLKKMEPIKKIPTIKKWKGKQAFNKKELIGKHTLTESGRFKWDRLCKHCVGKMPHDIVVHKNGIRNGVGHGGVAMMLGNDREDKLHGGLGL